MIHSRATFIPLLATALVLGGLATEVRAKKVVSPFAQQITALRGANALLAQADHDYKGHRVNGMKEVHRAIHVLKSGTKTTKNPFKAPKGKGDLPQNQSDKLLQQAIDQLTAVQTQLNTVQGPRATAAVTAIQKAIKELNIALKIK
jgi:hypothetical protein